MLVMILVNHLYLDRHLVSVNHLCAGVDYRTTPLLVDFDYILFRFYCIIDVVLYPQLVTVSLFRSWIRVRWLLFVVDETLIELSCITIQGGFALVLNLFY